MTMTRLALVVPALTASLLLGSLPASGARSAAPSGAFEDEGVLPGLDLSPVVVLPDPATPARCAERRRHVAAALEDGLLVIESGKEPDGRFHVHDDFYWLTGLSVPDSAIVLRAKKGKLTEEILFLPAEDTGYELWNGDRLAPGEQATELSGIADNRDAKDFAEVVAKLLPKKGAVYFEGETVEPLAEEHELKLDTPAKILGPLQGIRDADELRSQRAAIDITQRALAEAMRVAVPGAWEFEAEATVEGHFRRSGAEALAFPSIIGSGPNSCYLHYRSNQRQLLDGDILVMDVGAKFHHLCADVTRTIPVNGRFSARQREVYTLVWEASRKAAAVLKPGANLSEAHNVAAAYLDEHGFGRKYFPHSVGHGLGLRVHDAPRRNTTLAAGMVVTIEPGIYIAEENLGVRIEDDYLITEDGAELLSDDIPSEPAELEAFLASLRGL